MWRPTRAQLAWFFIVLVLWPCTGGSSQAANRVHNNSVCIVSTRTLSFGAKTNRQGAKTAQYLDMNNYDDKRVHFMDRAAWYALYTIPYLHVHSVFQQVVDGAPPTTVNHEKLVFVEKPRATVWNVQGSSLRGTCTLPAAAARRRLVDALGWQGHNMTNLVVYVHGYNNDADAAYTALKHALTGRGVPNGSVTPGSAIDGIVYDWASTHGPRHIGHMLMLPLNYAQDSDSALSASRPLAWLLCLLMASGTAERIHIMAHSLGTRVAVEALTHITTAHEMSCYGEPWQQANTDEIPTTCSYSQAQAWKERMGRIRTISLVQADMNMLQASKAIDNIEGTCTRLKNNVAWVPIVFAETSDRVLSWSKWLHGSVRRVGQFSPKVVIENMNELVSKKVGNKLKDANLASDIRERLQNFNAGCHNIMHYMLGPHVVWDNWGKWVREFRDNMEASSHNEVIQREHARAPWLDGISREGVDWRTILMAQVGCASGKLVRGELQSLVLSEDEQHSWQAALKDWEAKENATRWKTQHGDVTMDKEKELQTHWEALRSFHAGMLIDASRFLSWWDVLDATAYHSYWEDTCFQAVLHELFVHYEQYLLTRDQPPPKTLFHVHARLSLLYAKFGQERLAPSTVESVDIANLPWELQDAKATSKWWSRTAPVYAAPQAEGMPVSSLASPAPPHEAMTPLEGVCSSFTC